jgi:hypothetical protein
MGTKGFKILAATENLKQSDYLIVLGEAEADHCLTGCNGSLLFEGAARLTRFVEHVSSGASK